MANYKILTYVDSDLNVRKGVKVRYSDYNLLVKLSIFRILRWFNKASNIISFPVPTTNSIKLNDEWNQHLIAKYCYWSVQLRDDRRLSVDLNPCFMDQISIKHFDGNAIRIREIQKSDTLMYIRSTILNLLIWLVVNVLKNYELGINLRIRLANGFVFNKNWYLYLLQSYNFWNNRLINRTLKSRRRSIDVEIIGPSSTPVNSDDEAASPSLRPATPIVLDIPTIDLP